MSVACPTSCSPNADEIIRLKDAKRSVTKDLWAAYSRFVVSVRDKNGKERWVRNSSKIDEAVESAGYFALRSNVVSDAFEALAIYRLRNMVEQDFNQLKNWLDGDRLRVGAVSVQGKLLVSTIGTALRMMMLCSAKKMENRKNNTWSAPRLQGVNKFFKAQAPQALHFERLFLISAAKAAHHY